MDLIIDNIGIIIYILLWLILFFAYRRKNGKFTLGYTMIALYTGQSIVAFLIYNSQYSYLHFNDPLTLWPFLYLFCMISITLYPITSLKENRIQYIEIPEDKTLTLLCLFFSFFSIVGLIELLPQVKMGLAIMASSDSDSIVELYRESTLDRKATGHFTGAFNYISIIAGISKSLMPVLFYTYLIKQKKNVFVLILLSIALLQGPFSGIAYASRFDLIYQLFILALLYFFFRPYISEQTNKFFRRFIIAFFSLVILVFAAVSIARVQTDKNESFAFNMGRYYAEGPLYFDMYCMDANGTREGHIVAPLVLHIAGEKSLTEEELRAKYSYMKIDNKLFSTYIGDFVLDFGPWIASILLVLFSILLTQILRHRKKLKYGQVIAVFIVTRFCSGFYQYGFGSLSGNLSLIVLFILIVVFNQKQASKEIVYNRNFIE